MGLKDGLTKLINWRKNHMEHVNYKRKSIFMNKLVLRNKNIQIAAPSFGKEELDALKEPLAQGWLTQGPEVDKFEKKFKKCKLKHAIATTSCTTALHLALKTMNISEGDEVIVPAFTWISTANAVAYCGAKPVL